MDDEHIPIAPIEQDATPGALAPPAGWAKPKYEIYTHFFEHGRALCRMWNLPDEQPVDPAMPGPEVQLCGYCKRNAPKAHLRTGSLMGIEGPRPTLATVVTGSGDPTPEAVAAPVITVEQGQPEAA